MNISSGLYLCYRAKNILLVFLFLFCSTYAFGSEISSFDYLSSKSDASEEVRYTLSWILDSADNDNLPFAVIDKKNAEIFVFNNDGKFLVSEPVLIGISKSDIIDPKTLNASLSAISEAKRVTPAGRFISMIGSDKHGKQLLWVDYEFAIALHPVIDVPGQDRRRRLITKTCQDKRITWGCINVSPALFQNVIIPLFQKKGIVYILPEEISIENYIRKVSEPKISNQQDTARGIRKNPG
ncbi:MAG: hypothetical protein FDX30_10195 [Chlorobium sp.]|nr:MAG: hypothetical protein FDX30_10195 [Chlorobium sp.]